MQRVLSCSVSVLVILLLGLAWGDQKDNKDQKKTKNPAASYQAEVDRLLEEYDKNKDGYLQRDELPSRIRQAFDQVDTDKDGKLSREELQRGLVHLQPRRRPSDVVFVLIEMSDCDDDCCCELQQIYDVLRKLDKSNTGKIEPEALKTARRQLLEDRIDNHIKELDADKDGRISRQEARGRLKEHFDRIDTNKDGYLDRDELLRAAAEKLSSQKGQGTDSPASKAPRNPKDGK